jgi:hypothetical protein
MTISGCSAVRLAHLLWEQGVVGSNPATPTEKGFTVYSVDPFFFFKKKKHSYKESVQKLIYL